MDFYTALFIVTTVMVFWAGLAAWFPKDKDEE